MTFTTRRALWATFAVGGSLVTLSLYLSDSLPLVQSSVLHFFEHMHMLWADLSTLHKTLLTAGVALITGSLALLMVQSCKGRRSHVGRG